MLRQENQEDHKLKACLGNTVKDPISKDRQINKKIILAIK
jgi:hypothetical protein